MRGVTGLTVLVLAAGIGRAGASPTPTHAPTAQARPSTAELFYRHCQTGQGEKGVAAAKELSLVGADVFGRSTRH